MLDIRPGLRDLKPYGIEEADWRIKMDANERPWGLPSDVDRQVKENLAAVAANRYPEMGAYALRSDIAAAYGLRMDEVLVGNGSSELLAALCRCFGGPDRPIVYPWPSFSMYPIYAKLADSPALPVKLDQSYQLDPEEVLRQAQTSGAKLIILCNPNNPTGVPMRQPEIEYILQHSACPVVVDEAYEEFHGETAAGWVGRYPKLIVARTFSKAYGAAGARIGYLLAAAEVIAEVDKCLLPYRVNALTLAVARTIFGMREAFVDGIKTICAERERVGQALASISKMAVLPSRTNFILFRLDQAGELTEFLAMRQIAVRNFSRVTGLEGCVRVTVGDRQEDDEFLTAVRDFMNGRR